MSGAFNVRCDCLQMVYNNLTPMTDVDGEQVGEGGNGGQGQGQGGGQSKQDMLKKARDQLANGDYHGYQETMDKIGKLIGLKSKIV